jgi:hypothetical protein
MAARVPNFPDPAFVIKASNLERRLARNPAGTPIVVMIGSSRTMFGFSGERVEAVVRDTLGTRVLAHDVAFPGAGPIMEWVSQQRLREMGWRPDVVLLEFHPAFVAKDPSFGLLRFRADELAALRDFDIDTEEAAPTEPPVVAWFGHRHVLLGRFRPTLLAPCARTTFAPPMDQWGANRINDADQLRGLPFKVAADRYVKELQQLPFAPAAHEVDADHSSNQVFAPPTHRLLTATIDACRRDGSRVAIVITPEGPTFRSWYPPMARGRIRAYAAALAQQHDAQLVDAWDWYDDSYFSDSHHLLNPGAKDFSERLAREVVVPALRPTSAPVPASSSPFQTTARPRDR